MRALTGQAAAVEALLERSTRLRVSIDRTGSGGWVDLSSYLDLDWIDGVEYEDNSESPVGTLTVRIRREWHDLTLSPMMAQSRLNSGGVLIWPKREIKVEVAVTPRGMPAASGDWFEVFRGRIDKINWQSSPIDIRCRDLGGDLQDGFLENQGVYGTDAGRDIELVIQDILDDAYNNGWIPYAVTLYSKTGTAATPFQAIDSPGFLITKGKQGREPLMDLIQKYARVIGWECRYRWNAGDGGFRLTLYEPVRAVRSRGTITLTGDPSASDTIQIDSVTYTAKASGATGDQFNIATGDTTTTAQNIADMLNAGSGLANINAWADGATVLVEWQTAGVAGDAVTFTESMANTTMDGGGTLGGTRAGVDPVTVHTFAPSKVLSVETLSIDVADVRNKFSGTFETEADERLTVTRRNNDSIDKYHPRPFLLTEGASSPINTVEEMANLLDAADNDLSEPDLGQGISVPFFPWGEAADLYRFEANGIHYDSDQDLSAATLRHTINKGRARTTITARGKPSLGAPRWLEAEGRPGVAPPADIYSDAAADNVAATAGLGSIIVNYDDPRAMDPPIMDWAYSDCHVSESSGFTPGASTLKERGLKTRFSIGGLTPGVTYYAKIVIYDGAGNAAATSTQVTTATQEVGPYHENLDGQQDQLLRNNDLNIYTEGTTQPPDRWEMVAGTYASGGGADTAYVNTTDNETGNRSLDFNYSATDHSPEIRSVAVPFKGGDILRASVVAKKSTGSNTDPNVRLRVRWLDSAKAEISVSATTFDLTSSYQRFMTAVLTAPSTTRYIQIAIAADSATDTGTAFVMNVDKAGVLRAKGYAEGTNLGVSGGFGSSYTAYNAFTLVAAKGLTYSAPGSRARFTVNAPGRFSVRLGASYIDDGGSAALFEIQQRILVNGASVYEGEVEQAVEQDSSAGDFQASTVIYTDEDLEDGDYIEFEAKSIGAVNSPNVIAAVSIIQVDRDD